MYVSLILLTFHYGKGSVVKIVLCPKEEEYHLLNAKTAFENYCVNTYQKRVAEFCLWF